jgi:hypothetical protein
METGAGANAALSPAHAGQRRKKSAGHAGADVGGIESGFSGSSTMPTLKWPAQFGMNEGEKVELGHSSFSAFLAFAQAQRAQGSISHVLRRQYEQHKNTLPPRLNGSVQRDVYYAKARNYPSALEAALFHDKVPAAVYDNLIASVHKNLPCALSLLRTAPTGDEAQGAFTNTTPTFRFSADLDKRHTWDQAVKVVVDRWSRWERILRVRSNGG